MNGLDPTPTSSLPQILSLPDEPPFTISSVIGYKRWFLKRLEGKKGTTKLNLVLQARKVRLGEFGKELERAEREWEEVEEELKGTELWKERERLEGRVGK
eukprot:CAMPEP_0201524452 /NCGR_PEP_ID=MMETSP0161_2-20130828/22520_1 /ASSEMBLY_ACC=CAM_ASM_000251 /TAXON_ID=180227 /ORGANISM="Neoparamoeba aestuarina, Strain SoJaBio B1-5/56/2" /LENGTH=99 /DNA_ID=CAMNT_0047923855 /DNA_START=358 /DNA_END=654 /DNA_ORIENTATION=+